MLSNGFTKSQYGVQVINVREKYYVKYPGNPIYDKVKCKKIGKHDQVYSNTLFFPTIENYRFVSGIDSMEKKKKKHDSMNVKGELFWQEVNETKEGNDQEEDGM